MRCISLIESILCAAGLAAITVAGCSESRTLDVDADGELDGSEGFDGAGLDGAGFDGAGFDGAGFDGAGLDGAGLDGAGFDAGFDGADLDGGLDDALVPEACPTPGTFESVPCGLCGTVDRFCTAGRTWAYGECSGEAGECVPGSLDSVACGNCGTQPARCTASCTWESTGACSDEGVCSPGTSTRSGAGCPAGETRELTCGDACTYVASSACMADGCPTPGALETAPCGMCGTVERFCNASRAWEYGTCMGEGVCMPGTTGTISCGMCGDQVTLCTSSCNWITSGGCIGEGTCAPGTTIRTDAGCPTGETRLLRCDDTCGYSTVVEGCSRNRPVDVMFLFDSTGSNESSLTNDLPTLQSRCIAPLLALTGIEVGIAYAGEFPIGVYGIAGDRPFEGGIEPNTSASAISSEIASRPRFVGSDSEDSVVEALSVLSGGAVHPTALALTCSGGRVAGGCWRSGAQRVVVVHTDSPIHNGPDPSSAGLLAPYTGITPAPAGWPAVRATMISSSTTLIWIDSAAAAPAPAQFDEMLTDLGQPLTDRHAAATSAEVAVACDVIVARVRAIAGL
jgi:uncharacterized protein YjbI with pentapeptide repeats